MFDPPATRSVLNGRWWVGCSMRIISRFRNNLVFASPMHPEAPQHEPGDRVQERRDQKPLFVAFALHQFQHAAEHRSHLAEFYPDAHWQRCVVHFYRNVWTAVPSGKVAEVAAMLKAIHAQEDRAAAAQKAQQVVAKLRKLKLAKAAELVAAGIGETLSYYEFPREHWRCLRTNNPLERIMREIRRRTRVVGAFPDGQSALMLVAARLRHIAGTKWGTRRYLDMNRLKETAARAA